MTEKRVPFPVGYAVKEVRLLTDEELRKEGWEKSMGDFPVAIVFHDGSMVYASSDPEGNGPGALFGITNKGTPVLVHPDNGTLQKDE